ncbi:MAG TPA: glycosyltransferase [Ferruginibacter sp.]|nr:glycosyltransferase [Ferruginibacter sp.]
MNSENDTLVILTPGFPGSEGDTTCLPMQQRLVRTIKENFPSLDIIVLSFQYPYLKETYKWFDITVSSFNGKNKGGLARLWLRRVLNARLKEISQNNKIAGILSFWHGECAWVGKKFTGKNNIRHYCWILGQDAKKGNKYIKYLRLKENELIALSDFIQNEFEINHGTRPQFVIPPGIDAKQFVNPIKAKDIDIIAAGSLIPLKQYEFFIITIAEIKKQMPGIKAMLIGDGPEKNKLKTLITAYGLESNIILAGELSHPEVLQCMQRGKVFLHPSSYEGFGVVCIEALYAGCQVISFCRPMNRDIQHWHIVHDQAAMAQKAIDILKNPESLYKSLTPFPMGDTVKKMMALFGVRG